MKYTINFFFINLCLMTGILHAQTEFTFTGTEQTYVVPLGVSGIQIEVWGAQGGGSEGLNSTNEDDGGLGGYTTGFLLVNNGDELSIFVGGKLVLIPGGGNIGGITASVATVVNINSQFLTLKLYLREIKPLLPD